mgnify:FL=1
MLRVAGPADLSRLIGAWEALHADDPMWVPPLWAWAGPALKRALSDQNSFVMHILEDGGRVLATASAQRGGPKEAGLVWMGHLEAPDGDSAAAVLDAVRETARGWGADTLKGPRNLSRFEFVGLTVDGFEHLPPMLQGQHPPEARSWVEAAGYTAHHDHLAYHTPLVEADGRPRALPPRLAEKAASCAVSDLTFRRARRRRGDRDLIDAHTVLNAAYATVPDIHPMPRAQFLGICRAVLALGHPELIQLGYVKDRPVAFAVCLPEINEALAPVRGRLWPLGWLRLLRAWRGIRTAAFKLIGVVPELRGTGAHAALIAAVVKGAQASGFSRMEGSIIDERNKPMRGVVEGIGMTVYRRYRVYARDV